MPLFKCRNCGCVENTAVGNFWNSRDHPTCSECHTGTWHGRFPKVDADTEGYTPEVRDPQFIERLRKPEDAARPERQNTALG
jgi:hypothetical protein